MFSLLFPASTYQPCVLCDALCNGYNLCTDCERGMKNAHTSAFAAEACRPDDYPPFEPDDEEAIREPISPWVERALRRDLPTFDRHNGAFAYER